MSNDQIPHTTEVSLPKVREFDGHDWFSTKVHSRTLPHWELKGSTYFITFRVHDEVKLPFLHVELARIMISALFAGHEKNYDLQAYVIMPNHVHLLLKPINDTGLGEIMKTLKGTTAYQINLQLNRKGKFWQAENFDRLIRNSIELGEKWEYIKDNPVRAKLVKAAEEYPYSSFYSPK